jgi:colanic acid/amylovoran biosynthesis glycosyltransferase
MTTTIRVLHSVGAFLEVSENWIYPQVTAVSGVTGLVVAGSVKNQAAFPLGDDHMLICPSPWNMTFRGRRWLEPIERRIVSTRILKHLAIQSWEVDVLHAHFGPQGWKSIALKQKLGVPLVTSFYGSDAWSLPERTGCWRNRYRELFEVGDLFLVEGPAMRRRLTELGCPEEKIAIQRIGVRTPEFKRDKARFSAGLNIVMLGRFVEKKGLLDGLRACALAREQGVALQVTVIGDSSPRNQASQRLKAKLEACAADPRLAGCVHFAGFVPTDRVYGMIAANNVFLCPSKHAPDGDAEGGSPVILTEAMAVGLLCVGTRHCDIPEVILDGVTGLLCTEGDVDQMAQILVSIGKERVDYNLMTETGGRHVERNFSLERQMEALRGLYGAVLSDAGREIRPAS